VIPRTGIRLGVGVGAIVVVVALTACGNGPPASGGTTTGVATSSAPTTSAADEVPVYGAALRYVATLPHEPGAPPAPTVLWVSEALDRNVAADPSHPDVAGTLGEPEQRTIAGLVADVIRVEFVKDTDSAYLPDFSIRDGGAVVTLGAIDLAPDGTARLGISFTCGARCAEGQTLVLSTTGDGWMVDRITGPGWIT
jgi:hypothetical protein